LPVNFTYVSDDDTNDILYYLGTDGLTSAFQNPHTRGFITMSESSNYGGNVASQATNRNNSDFFHSWTVGSLWMPDKVMTMRRK